LRPVPPQATIERDGEQHVHGAVPIFKFARKHRHPRDFGRSDRCTQIGEEPEILLTALGWRTYDAYVKGLSAMLGEPAQREATDA